MTTTYNYTAEEARRDFAPRVRYGDLLLMGQRFGLSEKTVRKLCEGQGAPVRKVIYPGSVRAYYDRDEAVRVFLQSNQPQPINA